MSPRKEKRNPGDDQLERERFQLARPTRKKGRGEVPIDSVLPGVMRGLGLEKNFLLQKLASQWPEIVGVQLAAHTHPGGMRGSHLTVFVDHSTWLNELKRYGRTQMLGKIQKHPDFHHVTDLVLQLDPEPQKR